jgi:hypothetical protein
MSFKNVLPRPAMIVAVVAMIAAVSGSAYAASKIDGGEIRDNSVTGEQVKERSLDRVPAARKAKAAGRAKDADTVGGQRPEDLRVRWLLLNEQGMIEDQSGGFTILDAYDTNANAYIDAGESLEGKGLTATVAIQNQIDTDPVTAGVQGSRNGEAAVTRCQIPGVVECAPANAKTVNALVVTASNPDGSPAATPSPGTGSGTSTKRIYVEVTE